MSGFDIAIGVSLTMADGVQLNADLFRPVGGGRRPALLTLTPYTTAYVHRSAAAYARAGFAVAVVDVRGRGGSQGEFDLYNDGADGAACVGWVAAQTWCDGQVALLGGSYAGLNQWTIAAHAPPGLKAIAPVVAPMPGYDADGIGGTFPFYNLRWTSFIRGRTIHQALFADDAFWCELASRHYRSGAEIAALPDLLGPRDPVAATMITQFDNAAFWAARVPDAAGFARIAVPVLTATGTADNAQRGALEYRRRHLASRPDAEHFLLFGPWNHAGSRDPAPLPGDPVTDDAATLESAEHDTLVGFYDWALRGGPLPPLLTNPNRREAIFVAGAERWAHRCDAQCPATAAWHLGGESGFEDEPPATPISIAFPASSDEPPPAADLLALISGEDATNPAFLDPVRASFLTFLSHPLHAAQDWVGIPRLELSLTGPPTACDLACIVYEQRGDGDVFVLSSDVQRVRCAGEAPVTLRFDRFRLGARRLAAGSRIGLQIRILDSPAFQRPPGYAIEQASATALQLGPERAGTFFVPLDLAMPLD